MAEFQQLIRTAFEKFKDIARRGRFSKSEQSFKLDASKIPEYRLMLGEQFRVDGPSKSRVSLFSRKEHESPVSAHIDPDNWDAEFVVRENLAFVRNPELLKYLEKRNITDPVRETLVDVANHEIGHWEFPRGSGFGCPFDKPSYYICFVEPIHDELKAAGRFGDDFCKAMSYRLANAVSDVLNNFHVATSLSERDYEFSGQTLFWYLQGQECGRYSMEFSLFVKLNLALFGSNEDSALLSRFMHKNKDVGAAVSRLAKIFTLDHVRNRSEWEHLAREYAKEAVKFIEENKSRHQYSAGDNANGSESRQLFGRKGTGEGKEVGDDLTSDDIEKIMLGRDAGQGIPFFIKTTKALDAYYRGLAKRISISTDQGKLPSAKFPIIPLLREPYDPNIHSPEDVSTSKLYVDLRTRKCVPSVVKSRLSIEIPMAKEKRHLPDFVLMAIDSSGSMMVGSGNKKITPWGDTSYYHYALLTFYGILRFFELESVLHKIKIGGAIFSDATLAASELGEVKALLLNPVTGGTSLDLQKVMGAMHNSEGAVFSLISDGYIVNWNEIKADFIAFARRHKFFMIQIGADSPTSTDLRNEGFVVRRVDSAADVVGLAINLTANGYRGVVRDELGREAKKYHSLS